MTGSLRSLFYVIFLCVTHYQTIAQATDITAVEDLSVSIPCRAFISAKRINGVVTLIRWFHSSFHKPLYTLDIRSLNVSLLADISTIHRGMHFPSPETEGRFYLDLSPSAIMLRIDPVSSEDAGIYKCQIDFRNRRSVQSTIHLDVIVPPKEAKILDTMGRKSEGTIGPFHVGHSLQLTCQSLGGHPKPIASWKCSIPESYRNSINGSLLTIHSLNRDDQWSHCTCAVQNTNMTAPKSVTVSIELVLPPMELLLHSNIHTPFITGQNVQISCQSFGSYPRAHIVWKKEKESVKATERITDNGNVTTSFIEFTAQTSDDEKEIQCIAFNPDIKNYILRRSFIIKVQYEPEVQIIIISNQSQIIEGHTLTLMCNVRANPKESDIIWTFENKDIFNYTDIYAKERTLWIKDLKPSHNGKFKCIAENERGEGNDTVLIKVKHKPVCKEISLNYSYDQRRSNLNVTCNLKAFPEDVTFYWIRYDSTSNYSWTTGQVHTTRVEFQESSSELICWGVNEIGVQATPCRISLTKSSMIKTSYVQDLIISACAVIVCCLVIFIVLRRHRYSRKTLFFETQMVNIKDNCGRVISNCAEPSISSADSDSSTTPLKIVKKYPEPSLMDISERL